MQICNNAYGAPFALYEEGSKSSRYEDVFIADALEKLKESHQKSEYFSKNVSELLANLSALYSESKQADWEEGGIPTPIAYENASNFVRALPGYLQSPFIDIDRDGDFRFEWVLAPKSRISVSVGENPKIAYAAIVGGEQSYGSDFLGSHLPAGLADQAKRVFASV